MTLGFDDVLHAPLSKMQEAVTDWGQMVTKLETLAEDAGKGMRAKSDKADWQGVNAAVTKPFIAKTAKEFDDAAKSAKGVKTILDQGYAAFEKAKNDMKKIVDEEAPARKCTVGADGSVRATKPISTTIDEGGKHDPDYDDLVHKEQGDISHVEGRIKSVLDEANEADRDIAKTLKANMGDDRHNFSAPKFDNPDEMHAAQGRRPRPEGRQDDGPGAQGTADAAAREQQVARLHDGGLRRARPEGEHEVLRRRGDAHRR